MVMKLSLALVFVIGMSTAFATPTEWRIDFGWTFKKTVSPPGKPTTESGWNNVATDVGTYSPTSITSSGNATLDSNYYYGSTTDPVYETANTANGVAIYDTQNQTDSALTLKIHKNNDEGYMQAIGSNSWQSEAEDYGTALTSSIPQSAYSDFIFASGDTSYTVRLEGLNAGTYSICVAGGQTKAGGDNLAAVTYTLNGNPQTISWREDNNSNTYGGVLYWNNFEVGNDGVLELTVKGNAFVEYGETKYTNAALNAMIITSVPEPTTATLSLLALAALAARRRRK